MCVQKVHNYFEDVVHRVQQSQTHRCKCRKEDGQDLFVNRAVVIGGGDVVILWIKKVFLVVQQLGQDSADGLLVS